MKTMQASEKRLSAKFWVEFFEEFPLKRSAAEGLVPPAQVDPIRDDLLVAMTTAHHDNPACRSVEPLELFLLHTSPLNETELYGLLQSAIEGPVIKKASSYRILVSILAYFARQFDQLLPIRSSNLYRLCFLLFR
jgi:hypothetical protein